MWLLRYFYPIDAVSNNFQTSNVKEMLTASASSVFDIRKQKTAGVPGTFAEILTWLFQWNFGLGTALWSGRCFTVGLKPDGLFWAPSLPEHVPIFPVQGEEVHCYTSTRAKELTGALVKYKSQALRNARDNPICPISVKPSWTNALWQCHEVWDYTPVIPRTAASFTHRLAAPDSFTDRESLFYC